MVSHLSGRDAARQLDVITSCIGQRDIPRGSLQSSEEIAHEMAQEQHGEDLRDGAYDWCRDDRNETAADREARWAS